MLVREGIKAGVKRYNFSRWLHRKQGNLVVWRQKKDGEFGNALPCVLCRKAIEKHNIQWIAYTGEGWVNSLQSDEVPKSKPTHKQKRYMKFNGFPSSELTDV